MRVTKSQRKRAARGKTVVAAYLAIPGMDEDNALRDMLADLMHYARVKRINFENECRAASDNFRAEVRIDDIETSFATGAW